MIFDTLAPTPTTQRLQREVQTDGRGSFANYIAVRRERHWRVVKEAHTLSQ